MKHYNIPVFVPHIGCPFDCVFCNQKHITGVLKDLESYEIKRIIEEHLKTIPKDSYKEIAFFGGSFTGIPEDIREGYLKIAYEYVKNGQVSGIRLSTRPDYIDDNILKQLKSYGVTAIELGVQSMAEDVLAASNRGHTPEDVKKASKLIKEYGFELGLQMMTGLPEDTEEKALKTADEIIELTPQTVRIYPTLVIKDTRLEEMYKSGEYTPQGLFEAVELSAKLLKKFREKNINVIRIALMTTDEISPGGKLVAGPFHSSFRELVESAIYYTDIEKELLDISKKSVTILVNPSEVSKVIGNKRGNIEKFRRNLGVAVKVRANPLIKKGEFRINGEKE